MIFSSRLPLEIQPSRLARVLAELKAGGAELLDLTESNPTRAGIHYPQAAILAGLADTRSLVYDPESLGLPEARALIANLHGVDASKVVLTASTSEAYAWLFKLLCNPGDEVLIPRPSYPLFEVLASLEAVQTRPYALRYGHGWFIDFESLRASLTARTRAVVVVNPNNPTGNYIKPDEQAQLTGFCAEHGLALISDEVFSDYALEGVPLSFAHSDRALTFVLSGLSKLVGLPQMKLGWILCSGPAETLREALSRLDLIADTFLSAGTPVQYALPRLLEARASVQRQILARLRQNLAALKAMVAGSKASVAPVEAGWYAALRVPRVRTDEEWIELFLREDSTLVQPGFFYDFESEGWLILSLLTPPEIFQLGVSRVLASCES